MLGKIDGVGGTQLNLGGFAWMKHAKSQEEISSIQFVVPVVRDRVILLKNHEPVRSSSSVLHPFILMFPMTIFS